MIFTSTALPPEEESQPNWAQDSQALAYVCYLQGPTEGESLFDVTFFVNPPRSDTPWSHYQSEAADICTVDPDGQNPKRLTQELGSDRHPVWSPDGTNIAYLRDEGIYIITVDGHNQRRLVWSGTVHPEGMSWSSDGRYLLFSGCQYDLDLDIYLLNVKEGNVSNLTPNSQWHDVSPLWILNGTKIFFLSTASSNLTNNCGLLSENAPQQMKIIDINGEEERLIYKELYYPFITVSNTGQIAFISDMTSTTEQEYLSHSDLARLYKMGFNDPEPVEIPTKGVTDLSFGSVVYASWSPDGKQFLYPDRSEEIKILNIETGTLYDLPTLFSDTNSHLNFREIKWSPDSQKLAATVLREKGVDNNNSGLPLYTQKNIYLFDLRINTANPLIRK